MTTTRAQQPRTILEREPASSRAKSYRQSDAARRALAREIAAASLSVMRESIADDRDPVARHPDDRTAFASALSHFLRAHGDEHAKVRSTRRTTPQT
jgi:hypothetical protein